MIRIIMRDVRDASSKILDGTSLQDALDRSTALDAETKKTLHFDI